MVKGYFPLPLSAPMTLCIGSGIAYNNFSKDIESIHDVFPGCFCASHRNFLLSPTWGYGWLMGTFYDNKGGDSTFCYFFVSMRTTIFSDSSISKKLWFFHHHSFVFASRLTFITCAWYMVTGSTEIKVSIPKIAEHFTIEFTANISNIKSHGLRKLE